MWTDICVNLTNNRYRDDIPAVIERAIESGVTRMLVVGTNPEESEKAIRLCDAYPQYLRATVGCHPHDAKEMDNLSWQRLETLINSPYVVAIGECGLDFNRNFSTPEQQKEVFEYQLQLAGRYQLPVFLHERDAHDDMMSFLKKYETSLSGKVVHCFTGDKTQAIAYQTLGCYLGVTGWICDPRRNQNLLEAISEIQSDRLMIETDAPFLFPKNVPVDVMTKRNEPCLLPYIGKIVAELKDMDVNDFAELSTQNANHFFNWSF